MDFVMVTNGILYQQFGTRSDRIDTTSVSLIKYLLKLLLKMMGFTVSKNIPKSSINLKEQIINDFKLSGYLPWSPGYNEYKEDQIAKAISDENIKFKILNSENLPEKFGVGLDERIIEYTWFFSSVESFTKQANSYLDAGPVMNHAFVVKRARNLAKKVHFASLSHEDNCFQELDISYIFSDLRSLPIKDDFYDIISCISTLEHIGCDNSCYGSQPRPSFSNSKNFEFLDAAKELNRVMKPDGSLYITVPFGQYMHLGMIQQFDHEMIDCLVDTFGQSRTEVSFYKYSIDGWQVSDHASCKNSVFVKWLTDSLMNQQFPFPHPEEIDMAAAARSICCLKVNGK